MTSIWEDGAMLVLLWVAMGAGMLIVWGVLSWIVVGLLRRKSDPERRDSNIHESLGLHPPGHDQDTGGQSPRRSVSRQVGRV